MIRTISLSGLITRRASHIGAVIFMLLMIATSAQAQNVQFTQNSDSAGLDMSLQIPLRAYSGRGEAGLPITLYYSSKLWRIKYKEAIKRGPSVYDTILEAKYSEFSASGWTHSLSVPVIEWPQPTDTYNYNGKPICQPCGSTEGAYRIRRVYIHMPDGSTHELRKSDVAYAGGVDTSGTFYAVDGSRLRYDSTAPPYVGTLYLPDGTRYLFDRDENYVAVVRYIDRNGNTLAYSGVTGQWTDTLGRKLGVPPVNSYTATYPTDYGYSVPGVGGAPMNYIFRWRHLKHPSTGESALTDPGQSLRYVSDVSPSLFVSWDNGETVETVEPKTLFNPIVLTEIVLPNGTSYKFSYNVYGEIDKVIYPTGGYERYQHAQIPSLGYSSPPYTQTNRGVVSRWLSPSGSGTDEAQWTIEASVPSSGAYLIKTVAPDGRRTERYLHNIIPAQQGSAGIYDQFGYADPRNGLTYDERIYAPAAQGGAMLRRTLTQWERSAVTNPPLWTIQSARSYTAMRNARPVRTTSIMLDTGGNALATTTTLDYDTTYQFDVGLEQIANHNYDYVTVDQATAQSGAIASIPIGARLITKQTSYLTHDLNYRSRNILGLPTATTILNGAGQTLARVNISYDEPSYPLIAYGAIAGWTDPGTTARGNVTTTSRWVNSNNSYLQAHAQYDQCGSVKTKWDARGNQTQFDYSSAYNFAYPTMTTSPIPDTSGTHGSQSALVTTSVYDLSTGAVMSTTDANGQTTSYEYNDVLNRPTKVIQADGGWTQTIYGDTPGNIHVDTRSAFDSRRVLESSQVYDGMGRIVRTLQNEGASWLVSDTQYDQMGRVRRVSNPYRSTQGAQGPINPSGLWTTSSYDALGRVLKLTTPDGAQVSTTYSGSSTAAPLGSVITVTDQSGKSSQSVTDALGRVVRVVEDPNNLSYQTNYTYDLLGNLIHIAQGSGATVQHRYFKYDSLSRLTYERQVESKAAPFAVSDPLTGNSAWSRQMVYDAPGSEGFLSDIYDARNIRSHFSYDALGRLWQTTYSDGTPTVTTKYDRARAGYYNLGRLTEVATSATGALPATSQSYDYDLMGRVKDHKQTIAITSGTIEYPTRYTYGIAGQLVNQTYPSGRVVSYSYDDAARMKAAYGSGGRVYTSEMQYGANGGLASLTYGNGAVETLGYNNRLQLSTINLTKDGAVLQRYDYKYGQVNADTGAVDESKNNGQIARIEGFIGAQKQWQQRFSYDTVGRLSSAGEYRGDNSQLSYRINYDYDPFGNRYQFQSRNPASINPLPYVPIEDGDINKLTNRFNSGVTYDDAGRVIVDNKFRAMQYQYDANGRQKWAAYADGTGAATSLYDGAGQRLATIVNGTMTNCFVYDAYGKLVAEYGAASQSSARGTSYVFGDQQGSTRVVLRGSSSSSVLARHDYQPYGTEAQAGTGMRTTAQGYGQQDGTRQKYAGMETDDATGMAHTLWRKYDSTSGRWTAPDPYDGSMTVGDPQSFNRYAYVNNDPVNLTDPLGLMPASEGWGSVSESFWGGDPGFNSPHFGGPTAIGEALVGYNSRIEKPLADLREGKINGSETHRSHAMRSFTSLLQDLDEIVRIDSVPAYTSKEAADAAFRKEFGYDRPWVASASLSLAAGERTGYTRPPNPYPGMNRYMPPPADYKAFNISIPTGIPFVSYDVSVIKDMYGRPYLSLGPGLGAAYPIAVSAVRGNAYDKKEKRVRNANELRSVLEGPSVNGTIGAILVGGWGWSLTGAGSTRYGGVGTPQIGVNLMFTRCLCLPKE